MDIQPIHSIHQFVSGAVFLVDKPLGWTSFDVVNHIKGFVRHNVEIPLNEHGHEQRFKIGHAGTLDPLATGLLVICTGKMTKAIDSIMAGPKEYTGTIRFGQTTPSYDLETSPEGDFPLGHLDEELIRDSARAFVGNIWQRPPVFSAKQVNGKRAYESARIGKHVELKEVEIQVEEFSILGWDGRDAAFKIRCSKGTYIRSLANDLGSALNSGAHLIELRRTESAPFRIENAWTPEGLVEHLKGLIVEK